ncbi:hypothetical protein [Mongoliitalea lutea]|uniref:Uncharacterized protein n=1 Tax=Mongoliitalea lutea TaxID=849756 RepID=A0A8J3CW23_9BACT|nr:hypothetical protein [Mongoliitalea lutea]GHB27977.1 hypothetical protein GCM10008106_05650 [Mongoliitalea lutea]
MKQIVKHIKDQTEVWIQVWYEPYHWDNAHGYSHTLWLKELNDNYWGKTYKEFLQNN